MSEIAANYDLVKDRIAAAAARVGRNSDTITLVAVTKKVSVERIVEAYEAGLRDFGESYVQEALGKIHDPRLDLPGIQWHFIGHLQTNKAREVEPVFQLTHSVDSLKLAAELGSRAASAGRLTRILLEVKLDPVGTKFGIEPEDSIQVALGVSDISGIRLEGLMGIAPYVAATDAGARAEASRPAFRQLAELFCQLPETCRQTLSMGMTGDFEIAIEEGATLIRVGTGLFGSRI